KAAPVGFMVASCPAILDGHSKSQFFVGATSKSHPAAFFVPDDPRCNAAVALLIPLLDANVLQHPRRSHAKCSQSGWALPDRGTQPPSLPGASPCVPSLNSSSSGAR